MGAMRRRCIMLVLAAVSACSPVAIAPPGRLAIGRAPEAPRQSAAMRAAQLATTFVPSTSSRPVPVAAEVSSRVSFTDELALDAGFSFSLGAMLSAALRYAPPPLARWRVTLVGGPVIGCGGLKTGPRGLRSSCQEVPVSGGGLVGLDVGGAWRMLAPYAAGRYQLTIGRGLPWTHWVEGVFGLQVGTESLWYGSVEGGVVYLENRTISLVVPVIQLSVGMAWRAPEPQ
jgi:hypothetical protein